MVSLKDIAAECRVSVATVSKALNGQSDISEETKVRIREAADRLGYIQNSAARALKTNRTCNIGVIFVSSEGGLAHEYFSLVLDSVRSEAEKRGYDIALISRTSGSRFSGYRQHCIYRGVDGVVVVNENFDDPMVIELIHSELPVVTIDHVFNNRIAVISDNVDGPYSLVRYAAGLGHRKIAFIHGAMTAVTENRMTGFYRACDETGISVPPEYVAESAYHDPESCYRAAKKLLALEDRPTCIMFPDDFSSIGGLNAIREAGLKVPDDISVMGYDGINLASVISPKLTTYCQNTEALGRTAAARLIELIERPRTAVLDRIIIPGHLQTGGSVAAPAKQ